MKSTRVFVNTLFQVVSRAAVVLVSLLTTALLTRVLGVDAYGDYVFITSFVLLFVALTDFGTTTIGIREASVVKESQQKEIFSQVFSLRIILALGLVLVYAFLALALPQFADLRLAAIIASVVFPLLVLRTTSQAILQTRLRLDLSSSLETLSSFFFLILLLILVYGLKSLTLSSLLAVWAVSTLLSSLLGLRLSRRYLPLSIKFDQIALKKLARESLPLGFYLLVYSIYDRGIDSFILKTLQGSRAVGYYGLAYKFHGNLVLGAAFLMNSLFPFLSSVKDNQILIKKFFERAFTVLLIVGLSLCLFFFVVAEELIFLIAGSGFAPSVVTLRILLVATFFSYLNHLTGYLMVALGQQRKLLSYALLAFAVNLVFNLVFIPHFSFLAAAAVTILTEFSLFVLCQRHLSRQYDLKYPWATFKNNLFLLWAKKQQYLDEV